jgi:hypothetical protein
MNSRLTILLLAILSTQALPTSAQDHLVPETGILNFPDWHWQYTQKIRDVLLKDAGTYYLARMVCLPSFDPEWTVTVIREDKDDDCERRYFVEFVGAKKNLFAQKNPGGIEVKKSRVPLDRDTAEDLNKIWRHMLHATRYPKEPRIGADGATYHFSRFVALYDQGQADPLAGFENGMVWTPEPRSMTGRLVRIGEELKKYALANADDRDVIRTVLRRRISRLQADLDRR